MQEPVVFGTPPPATVSCRERPAAYAVIKNDMGEIAAIRVEVLGRDYYWLPGGGMHDGESPSQTIHREVREELGRQVTALREIGQATQFFFAGDQQRWYKMQACFFAAKFIDAITCDAEYELQWVSLARPNVAFFHECHEWAIQSMEVVNQTKDTC